MENNELIKRKIESIIQRNLYLKSFEIFDSSTLEDLGASSFEKVNIILEIEKEFNISILRNYSNKIYELDFQHLLKVVQKAIVRSRQRKALLQFFVRNK